MLYILGALILFIVLFYSIILANCSFISLINSFLRIVPFKNFLNARNWPTLITFVLLAIVFPRLA